MFDELDRLVERVEVLLVSGDPAAFAQMYFTSLTHLRLGARAPNFRSS